MTDTDHSYPFDPTGTKVDNRIIGEKHVLSPPAWKDYHFIVPKLAPFFRSDLTIRELNTGRELKEGVDWMATHRFMEASRSTARPIYGSITFFNKELLGVVELSYNTLGGDWTIDDAAILKLMTQVARNPRTTTWEQVVGIPYQFPVIDHEWHLDDLVGMSDVKKSIDSVTKTILETRDVRPLVETHIRNDENPHGVTKAQVGLSDVENLPPATRAEALNGAFDMAVMTPRRVRQSIERFGHEYTDQHRQDDQNPHSVTKAQVGLGEVQNLGLATEIQARNGQGNDAYMTPVRTGQAIESLIKKPFEAHRRNQDNPHQVTKAQVGLRSVQDYPIATRNDAVIGQRHDRYMTPVRVREAINRFAGEAVSEHTENRENPHEVTKAQVGLGDVANFPVASARNAQDPRNDQTYMTPQRTHSVVNTALDAFVSNDTMVGLTRYLEHVVTAADPHGTDASTLGLEDVVDLSYLTNRRCLDLLDQQVSDIVNLKKHSNEPTNPHTVTLASLGLTEVSDSEYLTAERSLNQLNENVDDLRTLKSRV